MATLKELIKENGFAGDDPITVHNGCMDMWVSPRYLEATPWNKLMNTEAEYLGDGEFQTSKPYSNSQKRRKK